MKVMKALVIGLGSSGIKVCDYVIERIRWELGDESHAPWVLFLGIETGSTQEATKTKLRELGDLLLITIDPDEYSRLLLFPELLGLNQWADMETLKKLPATAVTGGAGNIRMVGRLAFFYNYNSVAQAVDQRLNKLRNLHEAEAREMRGPLLSGENPELTFVGTTRIFVAGTLCGGTCSGMAGDFGFFLRRYARSDEHIIGLFTLPPAAPTIMARYKKNAYTALTELNYYHLVNLGQQSPIVFPDRVSADMQKEPYNLVYLFFPRGTDSSEFDEMLPKMIADRIFFNIFAPGTDPIQETVNRPPIIDRAHRAHAFLSVGFSTMEYPAERIIDACTSRQLEYTLGQWNRRTLPESEISSRLAELGLRWETLCDWLFSLREGGSIENVLQQSALEIAKSAVRSPNACENKLRALREAFRNKGVIYEPPPEQVYPGVVISTCLLNRRYALEQFRERVRTVVSRDLLDYQIGPAVLRDLMVQAKRFLGELRQVARPDIIRSTQVTDELLQRMEQTRKSKKLSATLLKKREMNRLKTQLENALREEIRVRLKDAVLTALHSSREEPGLLQLLEQEIDTLQRRFNNLVQRVMNLREKFSQKDYELSHTPPQAAGVILFKPDPDGTVTREYEQCLACAGETGVTWEVQREKEAREILKSWGELLRHVIPQEMLQPHEDWLYRDFRPHVDAPFPDALLQPILDRARKPFLSLLRADVFEKWWEFYPDPNSRSAHAREVCERIAPSVRIDHHLAQQGGRSPIPQWNVLALPNEGRHREDFLRAIQTSPRYPPACELVESPHKYRVLMIQEWHRWPLSAVPDIVLPGGLCDAICDEFPTFHTRIDVAWIPLTDKEIRRLEHAESGLILGVLCDIVQPKGGRLEIQKRSKPSAHDDAPWQLPLRLEQAAYRIVVIGRDLNNYSVDNAITLIEARIAGKRREMADDDKFVEFLINQHKSGKGNEIPGWNRSRAWNAIMQFCASDQQLVRALMTVRPIPQEMKDSLWRKSGDQKPMGGTYDKDGYYCTECGGLIGETDEEALHNGWRCYVNPEHCFYPME
jgi:hypothetical protein